MSTGPTGPTEPSDEQPEEINFDGDVEPVYLNYDATPLEAPEPDGVSSGDEKVKTGLDDVDLAEVKIDADKVVIDTEDGGGGGVKGLEDEAPEPAAAGGPTSSASPIGSGFQGPLSVDNVGDYLKDDNDWEAIDEAARERAEAVFAEREEEKRQANEDAADRQERINNAREARNRKRLAKRAQDWKDKNPGADPANMPEAFEDLLKDKDGNFIDESGDPIEAPDVDFDFGADGDPDADGGGAMRVPGDADIGDKRQSVVPNIGPGTPEHVESQRGVDMADFGQQGPSSYELKGQSESAVQEAIDLSSDAIKTVSAAVVDTLKELASVLNQHHDAIQTLRDIVASSGEEDVR